MNETILLNPMHASFDRRLGAFFIDAVILSFLCFIGGAIIPFLGGVLVWFFYAPVLESSELRATLGKHMLGIQVVDVAGRRISLKAAVIRNFIKGISFLLLCIGFFFALFSEKRQTLHDLLADTMVVFGRNDHRGFVDAWVAQVKNIFTSGPVSDASAAIFSGSKFSQIERLQGLRQSGALTEEEFQREKKKILGE